MPTVITTVGSQFANSYCSVAEATTYHNTRLFSTWNQLSTSTQETAVIMATRILDQSYEWEGFQVDGVQALQWPRTGPLDWNQWNFVQEDEIPQKLKEATAELAWQLTLEDRVADNDIERQKITSLTAGPVSLAFAEGVIVEPVPDAVQQMIPIWWGFLKGKIGIREVERS